MCKNLAYFRLIYGFSTNQDVKENYTVFIE